MSNFKISKGLAVFGTKIRDLFSRKFTFLIIPHGPGNPKQINIHLSHIVLFLLLWTAITGWGSYLSAQHVDYWRTKLNNQVLTMKVNYLVAQLDKNTSFLDQVKDIEGQLRELLQYKDEAAIIKDSNTTHKTVSTGGPTLGDQNELANFIHKNPEDISWNRLIEKSGLMSSETQSRIQNYADIRHYIDTKRKMFLSTPRGWPANGPLTSLYGVRMNPFLREESEEFHPGVDISGRIGTPIRATADGKVLLSGWHSGYGNLIVLQHDFGYTTRYGHNSKLLVKSGQSVKRGQIIALMGQTGRASGSHCHYEVWRYERRQNPIGYIHEQFPKFNNHPRSASTKAPKSKTAAS